MCFGRDPVVKNVLPYPVYERAPHITVLSGSQALDLEIMERTERLDKVRDAARRIYARGYDPTDYIDEIFNSVGLDPDTLTQSEIDYINKACR